MRDKYAGLKENIIWFVMRVERNVITDPENLPEGGRAGEAA